MDQNILKINLLAIAGFGVLVAIMGGILYLFRAVLSEYIRFLLPIPPLSVAAYVFVINFFRQYGGRLPESNQDTLRELLTATGIAALVFALLSYCLMLLLNYAQNSS